MEIKNGKFKGLIWIGAIILLAFYFSNGVAFIIRMIPWSVEEKIADKINNNFHPQFCTPHDEKAAQAFNHLKKRLYPIASLDKNSEIKFNISIIHSDQVNAYATLGGEIFVLSGLLRDVSSPEELAGVIAHEMAHVSERHVLQGILMKIIFNGNNLNENFFNIGFTKGEEYLADEIGLERLVASKINVKGYFDFFSKRSKETPKWMLIVSDHPENEARIKLAQKYLGQPYEKILSDSEWNALKNYCSN
jgi:predicted Zn-dependent protease